MLSTKELTELAKKIRLLVLDVDGVLTDGKLYFDDSGQESKAFSTLDGQGIKMLRKSGVEVGIITGRQTQLVQARAKALGIHLLIQGREDKLIALKEMIEPYDYSYDQIAFMGDDYPDLTPMLSVGLAFSVANGHDEVKARCHWQSEKQGGHGAVREACDLIMRAQGHYDAALSAYINTSEK